MAAFLGGILGFIKLLTAFLQWRSEEQLLEAGRAEANAATSAKAAEKSDAMAKVAANPASEAEVEKRLGDGSF